MSLYISLDTFLQKFTKKSDFLTYIDNGIVRTPNKLEPLVEYMERKNITNEDFMILWNEIENKNSYLTRFYNMSLQVKTELIHFGEILSPMLLKYINNNTNPLLKNPIRNMYWKEILQQTESGIHNVPTYLNTVVDLFENNIVHYKLLSKSSLDKMNRNNGNKDVEGGRFGSVLSSFYFRASIMNPYVPYSLNKRRYQATSVFTPTLGWSSYAYGFLESGVTEYVGTDVIPKVCKKTVQFIDKYYTGITKDIYCIPSEELASNKEFNKKYKNHFDLVFFSPPYYDLEKYPSRNQSIKSYKTYEEWLEGYWRPTVMLCYHVLKKGGHMCFIISDYGSPSSSSQHYELVKDMSLIVSEIFGNKISKIPLHNKQIYVLSQEKAPEQIVSIEK
uniref:DNA methylase N-4/N-6 domain-containing protein n=1 Tax=viral metagenome TaxID=1070528 RepID=A0A6C0AUY8_9ZZZZ|tara:strand:- start:16578 stop:17744 length:1167 start_codon:yes stop_codon:yes gene_type:complete